MCPNGDCGGSSYNSGIGHSSLPDCGSCGNCQDCVEPEVVHVKRKPFFNKCEHMINVLKEFISKGSGNSNTCSVQFGTPSVNNNTVILSVVNYSGPVEYSRDGVLFKDSPVFSGMPCGNLQFFVRQKNNTNCIVTTYVTVNYNCACIPNWQNTENPPLTDCIGNVLHYRQSDGCGNTEWRPSTPAQPCGCIPNWVPTTSPATTRCWEGFVETRVTDGCGNFDWRREITTCTDPGQCIYPNFVPTVSTQVATCNSQGQILDNAFAILSGISNADKWGLWAGTSYEGPNYAAATVLTEQNLVINNLKGYSYDNSYVIRLFNGSDQCHIDKPFIIMGSICDPTCIVPSFNLVKASDPTCNGQASNANGVLRLENVANGTKWQMCEGPTFSTCVPNFNTANPINGNAPINLATNISFTANQQYRYFTVRVFNGSQGCFSEQTIKFDNPCYSNIPQCIFPAYFASQGNAATCNGATPNNNASITINGIANAVKYGFSVGQVYSGPAFGSAISFSGADLNISGLNGSSSATSYVVRLFGSSANECWTDVHVTVPGVNCSAPCVIPTADAAVVTPATCSGNTPNNNASFLISNIINGTKYGYSSGNNYSGPAFNSATSLVGGVISVNNLAGSQNDTVYTVRIFNGNNTCYFDMTVTVTGVNCGSPCVTPAFNISSVAPLTCNLEASSNDGKIVISGIANGTAYQLCIGQNTFNCTPNFPGAIAISGSGPIEVITNVGFAANETTRRYWVRVYNGAQGCYLDKSIDVPNPCKSCCGMQINSATVNNI